MSTGSRHTAGSSVRDAARPAYATTGAETRVPWQAKFVLLAFIWGSSFLLMKVGLRALAPLQISGLRIFAGAAVLAVLLALAGGRLPSDRRIWAHLFVAGFFLGPFPFSLFALGEERVSSALAGIGNATTPAATVVCSLLLLRGDRGEAIKRGKLLGVVLGFLGVAVIMQPWQSLGRPDLLGFGMTLLAGASYGLGWTYIRRYLSAGDLGGLALPTAQLLVSAAQMVPILLGWWLLHRVGGSGGPDGSNQPAPWSVHGPVSAAWWPLAAVLALGVVGTGLAYSLQFDVMRAAGPTVAASVTYVIPVVSVALGVVLLGERLALPQVLGAAVVVTAAVLIQRPRRS